MAYTLWRVYRAPLQLKESRRHLCVNMAAMKLVLSASAV